MVFAKAVEGNLPGKPTLHPGIQAVIWTYVSQNPRALPLAMLARSAVCLTMLARQVEVPASAS